MITAMPLRPGRNMRYRVTAYNTATASTNKIHDDSVARSLGFQGGLVPGVDVYAYLCRLPAERWGRSWLERGTINVRFDRPVYDGDDIEITGETDGVDGSDALRLRLVDSSGTQCALGRAAVPDALPQPADLRDWPSGDPPAVPPIAGPETLLAAPFGMIEATFVAERAGEYLDDIRETLPVFRDKLLAHPGWLLRFANSVLTANVRMGPWIHVESAVRLLAVVGDGDRVQTRARVSSIRERGGHRFVDLDVLQVVSGRAVTHTAHTAIYQPRGT